jgi:hypothetical protein
MKRWFLTLPVLALVTVSTAWGNPPPPPPPPPPPGAGLVMGPRDAKLVIKKDENAKSARLVIPAGMLVGVAPKRVGALDRMPALMAGLALTAAFVSGGFWLVRRNRAVAAVVLFVSVVVFGASTLQADLARPPRPGVGVPIAFPATIRHEGNLTVDVVPQGDTMELIVPPKMIVDGKPADPKAPGNE